MKPIKPFEILSTKAEPDGTGVTYRVSKKSVQGLRVQTDSMESYVLVPANEDIDAYVYNYLLESGWIE